MTNSLHGAKVKVMEALVVTLMANNRTTVMDTDKKSRTNMTNNKIITYLEEEIKTDLIDHLQDNHININSHLIKPMNLPLDKEFKQEIIVDQQQKNLQ
jgi:hypothetical protein